MRKFFDDFILLNGFTLNLDSLRVICPHCHRYGTLMSHGFIYRKSHGQSKLKVGKRLYCSNRRGGLGCGRTFSLFIKSIIPRLHYRTNVLNTFVNALLSSKGVTSAYHLATGQDDTRNGWRWLKRLKTRQSRVRQYLYHHYLARPRASPNFTRYRPNSALFASLFTLMDLWADDPCANLQLSAQQPCL